jgi:hypothetical protein
VRTRLFTPQPPQQTTPQNAVSCKKRPSLCIFQWLPVTSSDIQNSFYSAINAHNKCDSKYSMRLATRVQVVELWSIKCGRFCARTRRKVATWLQEEEHNEFVKGLHWISLRGKGLSKFKVFAKVLAKGVWSEILQWLDWGYPYTVSLGICIGV